MPSYDVPDVPAVYLVPPPHPVPTTYKAIVERAGKNITLKVNFPDIYRNINFILKIEVWVMDNEPMSEFFDRVCANICQAVPDFVRCHTYKRGYVCAKRSIFVSPQVYVEQKALPPAVIYSSDTAYDLFLTDGAIINGYLFTPPPVPDPL